MKYQNKSREHEMLENSMKIHVHKFCHHNNGLKQ